MNMHPLFGLHWSARLTAWQRQHLALASALLAGIAAAVLLKGSGETPWLAGWVSYCAVYLILIWKLAAHLDANGTRRRAQWIDPGSAMLFGLVTSAACASMVAVALAVDTGRSLQGWPRWGHLTLAVLALTGAWLLIQTAFALHYARVYYRPPHGGEGPVRPRAGVSRRWRARLPGLPLLRHRRWNDLPGVRRDRAWAAHAQTDDGAWTALVWLQPGGTGHGSQCVRLKPVVTKVTNNS